MTSPIYLVKLNLIFVLWNHYIFFGLLSAIMVAVWPFVLADDSVLSLITNRNLKPFCGFCSADRTGNYRRLVKTDCSSSNCCSVQATPLNTSFCSEGTYSKARGIWQQLFTLEAFDSFIQLNCAIGFDLSQCHLL